MQAFSEHIQSKMVGYIGYVLLNRPDRHNAINRQMWLDIPGCMQALMKAGARLLVLQGAGDAFAAGADLYELQNITELHQAKVNWDAIMQALEFVHCLQVPTIAAIDGSCLGGGCLLASSCDLRYASKRSRFSVPIAKLGLSLDDTTLARLAALIGIARTKDLIFRARVLDAEQAYSWGLVNEVFENENFDEQIQKICAEISENSHLSMMEAKASFTRFMPLATNNSENDQIVIASYLGPDFKARLDRALRKDRGT